MAKYQYLTSPPKTTTWPPGVPYIIGNEAAERFSYYGMNSILTIFMTKYLVDKMGHLSVVPAAAAEAWYPHIRRRSYIFSALLGAILADAFFGKFKSRSLVVGRLLPRPRHPCADGIVCRAHDRATLFARHRPGGVLIAAGAGGIKPCVSTNVGDQFGETNKHLLPKLFNWFYFSINAGSAVSTLLIPWLLEPGSIWDWLRTIVPVAVSDFLVSPRLHSPDVAFRVLPGVFMVIATIFFWMGRKKFVHIPPTGRQFFDDAMPREKQMPFLGLIVLLAIGLLVGWWRNLGTLFFGADILLAIAVVLWGVRPVLRYHFYARAVRRGFLGALAAEFFFLDRSGGEHGPPPFRD